MKCPSPARVLRWLFVCASLAAAAADLPSAVRAPEGYRIAQVRFALFDTAAFDSPVAGGRFEKVAVEGRRWEFYFESAARPVADPGATAVRIAAALEGDGWTVVRREPGVVARKGDLWLSGYGNSGSFRATVVEKAPLPRPLKLVAPGAAVESVADSADFPWLAVWPTARLKSTRHDDRAIDVTEPGARETAFAGPTITRRYDLPPDVAPYEFVATYKAALEAAGWKVVRAKTGSDAMVLAHYVSNGRDIWLSLHAIGIGLTVSAADVGASAAADLLKRQLAAAGHVALYGIYFDTDSSTPRPESAATLQQVLELLHGSPALRLEIQGHTDDTGAAAHNQELSEKRAASVRSWLATQGIAESRLASRGYGPSQPVADNKTPEGKAKNRRVELKNL